MTSTVNEAVATVLRSTSYDVLSTTVGLAVVIALAVLLYQRDASRLLDHEGDRGRISVFDVAVVPFLLAFFVIITTRLVELVA